MLIFLNILQQIDSLQSDLLVSQANIQNLESQLEDARRELLEVRIKIVC